VHCALPDVTPTAEQPETLLPLSVKATLPAGAPADPLIVTVKVTACPVTEGFADDPSVIVAFTFAESMVCVRAVEVLALNVALPA
jgi:hypothetical protein